MAHIAIAQNSYLKLYGNIEVTDGVELVFTSRSELQGYFNRRLIKQYNNISYVYRDGRVKILDTPQVVSRCNFISFTNPSFENKEIYARIVDYEYINNNTVEIIYQIDWWLTFMFDVSFKSCQIAREHLSETDWGKAVANPWRHDILELETAEGFSFTDSDRPPINTQDATHFMKGPDDSTDCYVMLALTNFTYEYEQDNSPEHDFHILTRTGGFSKDIAEALKNDDFDGYLLSPSTNTDGLPDSFYVYIFKLSNMYESVFSPTESGKRQKSRFKGFLDDLTAMGRTSQIIALYYAPKAMVRSILGGMGTEKNSINITQIKERATQGYNPKLKRFPFSYMTAETPSGVRKEYHYERFTNPGSQIDFGLIGTYNGFPYMSLVPFNYLYGNPGAIIGPNNRDDFNIVERLDYLETPQLGYTTDGFLSYLSSIYADAKANQSTPAKIGRGISMATGAINTAAAFAPSVAGLTGAGRATSSIMSATDNPISGATAGVGGILSPLLDEIRENNVRALMGQNAGTGSPYYDYSTERALYDSDVYHAGSVGGYPSYKLNRFYFSFYFKTLSPAWTNIVDNYFNAFGYNSGRIGTPRVTNLTTGRGDWPHFVQYDGAPTTYVKTTDAHVISNMAPVSSSIENLFNSGCRFIKGDGR